MQLPFKQEIKFRPYQRPLYEQIINGIEFYDKILAQAETGWGKSILIGVLANQLKGRTLILTHRIELLNQNSEWIDNLGVLTAKVRKVQLLRDAKNVISMAQTCRARFSKYGSDYLGSFDNVICDEIHVDFFKEVYDQIPNAKVIAVTATPIIDKKIEKLVDGVAFVKKLTMANEFEILYQGVSTRELIELGYLTRDFNIALTPPNLDKLKSDEGSPDGYTSKSMSDVFGSSTSLETVIRGYNEYCSAEANNGIAKKTIIFNPTTKVNKLMHEAFLANGIECKLYDSVNTTDHTRNEITEWFKNTDGAVLLNVGVFTTGFSVNDIDAIIYNKKTKSLSLWLQSIGRGSRVLTKEQISAGKIKPNFLVLDMGLNIATHGKWSEDRDWQNHFILNDWKLKKESDLLQMWECSECGYFNLQGTVYSEELDCLICEDCEAPKKPKQKKKKYIEGDFVVMEEPTPPKAYKIIEYVKRVGGNQNMVLQIVRNQILELFKYHTTKEDFLERRESYVKRIGELYRPAYFACIKQTELTGANKRLSTELHKILDNVEKYYGIDKQ
jgi:superfamily II DNA or RNA helicase